MLQYDFMRRALLVGFLLSIILPVIGTQVVVRRLSLMGDAISHSALAGVAAGLVQGLNPTFTTMIATVIAALAIEFVRKKVPNYAELALAIILSTSLGLAGVLTSFVKGTVSLESFLFGSIVAIGDGEVLSVLIMGILVLLISVALHKELFNVAFDSRSASLQGIWVDGINVLFTIMSAITIAIASRTIGALIVSSIMVVPIATSMQFSKSYKCVMLNGVGLSVLYVIAGLVLSFYLGLKPGATIVLLASIGFMIVVIINGVVRKVGA